CVRGRGGLRRAGGEAIRPARHPRGPPPLCEVPAASRPVRTMRRAAALLLLLALAASAGADEVLVLKDGRKIPVTRLARRDGQVVFQTSRGEVFSVPEDQVVSPPLASIQLYEGQVLVLKDGRKIPVTRLARRGGRV